MYLIQKLWLGELLIIQRIHIFTNTAPVGANSQNNSSNINFIISQQLTMQVNMTDPLLYNLTPKVCSSIQICLYF
jgi:hypothetical protein